MTIGKGPVLAFRTINPWHRIINLWRNSVHLVVGHSSVIPMMSHIMPYVTVVVCAYPSKLVVAHAVM